MSLPLSDQQRKTRRHIVVAVSVVALVVAVATVLLSLAVTRPERGRARVVLEVGSTGQVPDNSAMVQAADILVRRAKAAGLREPRVEVNERRITFSAAGDHAVQLQELARPGQFRVRPVLEWMPQHDTEMPEPTQPSPGAPDATTSAKTPEERLQVVKDKLGIVYRDAEEIIKNPQLLKQAAAYLAPFGKLSGDEVAVLPPSLQLHVPTITCEQLNARPAGAISAVADKVAACGETSDGQWKYLLDSAQVTGDDVRATTAEYDHGAWAVQIEFSGSGQPKWTELTRQAYNNGAMHLIAFVVDNVVASAPGIRAVIKGGATISTNLTEDSCRALAGQLSTPPLPVNLTVVTSEFTR